ncbi:MAG: ArsR family transcriptional regulator [Alicyclobacillus sp. RIFOXYA1_FULL_53_8]|nr:MAG: ArsR family transcriptional regulator [Alicyclobacillus sp. RIFOXYA1_FULL_53_8]
MSDEDSQILIQLLKVLADESRIRILGILADHEASVDEITAYLGLKAPTVSHHLSRLRELGLVQMRPEGNTHFYRFQPESLRQLNRLLQPDRLVTMANIEGDGWERKILRDFLIGEKLKEIPASRKKRVVILKWLAEKFAMDIRYPESEVNEIISRHHPDFATLRRELIGNQLMERENGVYWRINDATPVE